MNRDEWGIKCNLMRMEVGQVLAVVCPDKTYVLRLDEIREAEGIRGLTCEVVVEEELQQALQEAK